MLFDVILPSEHANGGLLQLVNSGGGGGGDGDGGSGVGARGRQQRSSRHDDCLRSSDLANPPPPSRIPRPRPSVTRNGNDDWRPFCVDDRSQPTGLTCFYAIPIDNNNMPTDKRLKLAAGKVANVQLASSSSDARVIAKEVSQKSWKAVRFSATCSRGCNTPVYVSVSKSVQTVTTDLTFRLNRWPSWRTRGSGGRVNSFHHPLWMRRILSSVFSQLGIVLFLATWIAGHAALFQHLEHTPDLVLVNDVTAKRNEMVVQLATELRQVFPYELAWRRKIDDYFTKFETTLANATQKGYATNRRAFYRWTYADFLLFSLQIVTGQGFGTDVPKTETALVLTVPCVLVGLPFMWLLLLDLGAKWADLLTAAIHQLRWKLSRRYPDVVSLHPDGLAGPPKTQSLGNGQLNGTAATANGQPPPETAIWTVENAKPAPIKVLTSAGPVAGEDPRQAAPWLSTLLTILYPLVGSVAFGLWADLSPASSFAVPLLALMLVSPPSASLAASFWWRATFHLYLLVGWVMLLATCLLWLKTWRAIVKQWAHDLSAPHYTGAHRTYPIQVR